MEEGEMIGEIFVVCLLVPILGIQHLDGLFRDSVKCFVDEKWNKKNEQQQHHSIMKKMKRPDNLLQEIQMPTELQPN